MTLKDLISIGKIRINKIKIVRKVVQDWLLIKIITQMAKIILTTSLSTTMTRSVKSPLIIWEARQT